MKDRNLTLIKLSFKQRIWLTISLVTSIHIAALFFVGDSYQPSAGIFAMIITLCLMWLAILNAFLVYLLRIHEKYKVVLEELVSIKTSEKPSNQNEVDSLDFMFNHFSSKVKSSFEELKAMSDRIDSLNKELVKKINVLFSIMQIHEIFSRDVQEESVFPIILNKLKEVLNLTSASIILINDKSEGKDFLILPEEERPVLREVFNKIDMRQFIGVKELIFLDQKNSNKDFAFLREAFNLTNMFIKPISSQESFNGFLIGGNQLDSFHFSREDMDLIEILSKNIVLIWEHKRLSRAVENLEIYDPLTGLYNKKHIEKRLGEEIKRATTYQRPCGVLLIEATNLKDFQDKFGTIEAEKTLKKLAKLFKDTLRPIDIAARIDENKLLAILIERNKRQCFQIGESISNTFDNYFKKENLSINFVFSVAENPLDGETAQALIEYASTTLQKQ